MTHGVSFAMDTDVSSETSEWMVEVGRDVTIDDLGFV